MLPSHVRIVSLSLSSICLLSQETSLWAIEFTIISWLQEGRRFIKSLGFKSWEVAGIEVARSRYNHFWSWTHLREYVEGWLLFFNLYLRYSLWLRLRISNGFWLDYLFPNVRNFFRLITIEWEVTPLFCSNSPRYILNFSSKSGSNALLIIVMFTYIHIKELNSRPSYLKWLDRYFVKPPSFGRRL